MKEKDIKLKRLSRRELLEIVVIQSEEIDRLSRELAESEKRIEERQKSIDDAGSIAEAALELNGVFDAAQQASEQYISEIRKMKEKQEEIYRNAEADARKRSEALIKATVQKCKAVQEDTMRKCNAMISRARSEAENSRHQPAVMTGMRNGSETERNTGNSQE